MIPFAHYMIIIFVVNLLETMLLSLPLMLEISMREEEVRALFMCPSYLECKYLIMIFFGYQKLATFSCMKCQCIGRELDLKVFC
jgi:hypothetical protein